MAIPPENYYDIRPVPLTNEQIASRCYRVSLKPLAELAFFIHERAACWSERGEYEKALINAELAVRVWPHNPQFRTTYLLLADAVRAQIADAASGSYFAHTQ